MGSWHTEIVVSCGDLANHQSISIAMDLENQPKISYYDADLFRLMYTEGLVNYIDLAGLEVWLIPPGPFFLGDPAQAYANITNLGTQDSGAFIVRFYDGNPASGGTQIGGDQGVPNLGPGNYSVVSVSWTTEPAGLHYIYADVNPDEAVSDPFQINDLNYTITQVIDPFMHLEPGWNLISLPLNQTNTSLLSVLDSISLDYDAVQYYNSSDNNKPWKHYQVLRPTSLNDLSDLDHLKGFWIHITNPDGTDFNVSGDAFSSQQNIILKPGWNHVGYPSLSSKDRSSGLNNIIFGNDVDAIWTFNASQKQWKDIGSSDDFEVGQGYWIHSIGSTDIVWQVPL
jgi:hypothetical protein